jgi:hypothetical protein
MSATRSWPHAPRTLPPREARAQWTTVYEQFYLPALRRARELGGEDFRRCRELAAYRRKLLASWPQVRVESVSAPPAAIFTVGERLTATARAEGVAPAVIGRRIDALVCNAAVYLPTAKEPT